MLKWRKINHVYNAWLVMKVSFLCLLVAIALRNFGSGSPPEDARGLPLDSTNLVLLVPLSVLHLAFLCTEVVQAAVSLRAWGREGKSWLQLAILSATLYLLIHFWHLGPLGGQELARQCIAFLLPLSYYEFLHELGCHPRFSKYILLFKRISIKFVRYTSIYIGLVIMCAFSFIVIKPQDQENVPETFVEKMLNTILMFIGEVGIPPLSEEFYTLQVIFFLLFVFFVVIVLMNLLNALAVADAKEMLEDAEMEMLHDLLVTISFWETVHTG
jgi:hypothetical protein